MASLATRASLVRFPAQAGEFGQARGILLQLTAVVFFALMGATAKAMGEGYGTAQVVFFRCWPALIPLLLYLPSQGGFSALKTKRPQLQAFRSIAGVIAMLCGFYALSQMAYADYVSLSYSAPLFGTIFAIILLREQVGWRRISAIAVGFVGILLVVGPSSDTFQPVAIFGLATAVIYGMVMVAMRKLGSSDSSAATNFYFTMTCLVVSGGLAIFDWKTPTVEDFFWLSLIGILGGIAQLLMTEAYRHAPTSVIAPFDYTGMVWAIVIGFIVFDQFPTVQVLIGTAVICGSGLFILHREITLGVKKPKVKRTSL